MSVLLGSHFVVVYRLTLCGAHPTSKSVFVTPKTSALTPCLRTTAPSTPPNCGNTRKEMGAQSAMWTISPSPRILPRSSTSLKPIMMKFNDDISGVAWCSHNVKTCSLCRTQSKLSRSTGEIYTRPSGSLDSASLSKTTRAHTTTSRSVTVTESTTHGLSATYVATEVEKAKIVELPRADTTLQKRARQARSTHQADT